MINRAMDLNNPTSISEVKPVYSTLNLIAEAIGVGIIVLFSAFCFIKKKKNFNKLTEREKEIYNNSKSKINKLGIICVVLCVIVTVVLSFGVLYEKPQNVETDLSDPIVMSSSDYESKFLIVENYLSINIFIFYLLYRVLIKIIKKISQEEKEVIKKCYSGITILLLIQMIIMFLTRIFNIIT